MFFLSILKITHVLLNNLQFYDLVKDSPIYLLTSSARWKQAMKWNSMWSTHVYGNFQMDNIGRTRSRRDSCTQITDGQLETMTIESEKAYSDSVAQTGRTLIGLTTQSFCYNETTDFVDMGHHWDKLWTTLKKHFALISFWCLCLGKNCLL